VRDELIDANFDVLTGLVKDVQEQEHEHLEENISEELTPSSINFDDSQIESKSKKQEPQEKTIKCHYCRTIQTTDKSKINFGNYDR